MEDDTRAPYSADDYMQQIMDLLGVNTSADAFERVKDMRDAKPIVTVDATGRINIASGLTVRQVYQVITALENVKVG